MSRPTSWPYMQNLSRSMEIEQRCTLQKRLQQLWRRGFWDALFVGSAFAYSVTCSEFVELASDLWNILLCKESEDAEATKCSSG